MSNEYTEAASLIAAQTKRTLALATRILNKAESECRDLTEDEQAQLDGLIEDGEAALDARTDLQIAAGNSQRSRRKTSPEAIQGEGNIIDLSTLTPPPRGVGINARAQWAAKYFGLRNDRQALQFGTFLDLVANAPHDSRLSRIQASASEGVGAEGGFLVPAPLQARILGGMFVESSIVGRVSLVPMTSNSVAIAGFNRNNSQTGGAIGGISFSYTPEQGNISEKTPAIVKLQLNAHKAAAWVPVSNELLSDSPFVSTQLADAFTEAGRARLELDIISGTGAGQPLGILNCPSTISQAKETSQTAATINYTNIIKMASRLHPSYWGEAAWLASVATIPQLLNLQVKIQNVAGSENVGGSHYVVETDAAGNFRILGKPVLFTAGCSTVGTVGDLILVAPSQYALGVRAALTVESSPHERFRSDETSFRAKMRHDGQSTWASALTLPGTSDTVSWAVTLATRA